MKTRRYQHEKDYFTYEMYSESYKEVSEKAGLKLNIQKTKIMASGPVISWQIDGKDRDSGRFYFLGLQNHCGQ